MDTLGLLLAVLVHPASVQDRDGARLLVRRAKGAKRWPRLQVVFADGGYAGPFIGWVREWWQVAVRIIKRSDRAVGFEVLPKRWVVERTFGWLGDYRRLSKDYEFHEHTSETMIHLVCCKRVTGEYDIGGRQAVFPWACEAVSQRGHRPPTSLRS